MRRALLLTIFFLLVGVACSTTPTIGTSPTSVSGAKTTFELGKTATLIPTETATSTPTLTPTETATSTPILTPTPIPLLSVKVLSYNILWGAGVDRQFDDKLKSAGQYNQFGKNRLPDLLAFIKLLGPDVVGIQEAAGWDTGTPSVVQEVAEELGMNYFLAKSQSELKVVILSKFEITQAESLSSEVGNVGALRATLTTQDGQPLNVFVVHLDPFSSNSRMCQVNTVIQQMQPYMPQRTILIGDMNFKLGSREYNILKQAGLKLVAWDNWWGIDQIWITPAVNWSKTSWFESFRLPVGISDHKPIGAEINILPTLTKVSTITPIPPTPTIVAPPVVSDTLTDVYVIRIDRFDDLCTKSKWISRWETEKFTNGVLEVGGEEYWKAGVLRSKDFAEGQGVILRFQFAKGTEAEIYFDSDEWNTDSYRRFGIYIRGDAIQTNVWQGKIGMGGNNLSGNFKPEPDTWYNLMIVINNNGEFMEMIWDSSDPSRAIRYRKQFGKTWAGLTWRFAIGANRGEMLIDDYTEFSFGELK